MVYVFVSHKSHNEYVISILVDISGTIVGESPDCLLLPGIVVGENLDNVCWDITVENKIVNIMKLSQQ